MARRRLMDVPESEFRQAVADARSLRDVIRRLDLHDHSNTYNRLREEIERQDLKTDHFNPWDRRPRTYTDQQLRDAVASSRSIRQTLLKLGIKAEGGNYRTIRREIDRLKIDLRHFEGQGWRRGVTKPISPRRPLETVLVQNSPACTSALRRRLINEGVLEARCQMCGLTDWHGQPISLELDHINGVNDDHRLQNLRLLCPNCHSQTETFRGRNMRRQRSPVPTQLSIL